MISRIQLQEAFKFALSMVLIYWLALWMDWDLAKYGALAIVLISLSTAGASLNKGMMRVIGTVAGCLVAYAFLDWFGQERWPMMIVLASYLVLICYFMQGSRYPYAWFVSGFVPLVIWADTYQDFDNVFHFSIFRLLETAAGVLIYSIVSTVLWPQTAGDQLHRLGSQFLGRSRELFGLYRRSMRNQQPAAEVPTLRLQLDRLLVQIRATLQAAYQDTDVVKAQKRAWALVPGELQALTDALDLWGISIEDCRQLAPERRIAGHEAALQALERRFERIEALWKAGQLPGKPPDQDDTDLLQELRFKPWHRDSLTHSEWGALLNCADLLHSLDRSSRNLLATLRVLAGIAPAATLPRPVRHLETKQPLQWDPERFTTALIPALAFIIGYLFWIYPTDPPPGGQANAQMSGTFGLMVGLGIFRPSLVLAQVVCGALVVTPIYFIVMPWLDTGFGLLTMIFLLSFVMGCVGTRWPMIKVSTMLMFVVGTGISNDQSYSFIGFVNMECAMIMAGAIVSVVVLLMQRHRPEQRLLRGIREFFRGCASVTAGFTRARTTKRMRKGTDRRIQQRVETIPAQLRVLAQSLDYRSFPDNPPDKVDHLLDTLHNLASRLRIAGVLLDRIVGTVALLDQPPVLGTKLPEQLRRLFERWTRLPHTVAAPDPAPGALQQMYNELEQRLTAYASSNGKHQPDERMLTNFSALLGGVRGLLFAMTEVDRAIAEINWEQWEEARF